MTSPVRASVRAAIRAFSIPLEGRKSWLYLDAIGLPTTGIGCALETPDQSAKLAWLRADGSRATVDEIRSEWAYLKGMPELIGTLAESQRAHVELHLDDDEIERLFWSRVEGADVALANIFPDFSSYPAPAQFALLSMCFAMGSGKFKLFVRMLSAMARRDWPGVAVECFMQGKGLDRRNAANRRLFLCAAACEADGGDPDALDLSTPTLAELEARFLSGAPASAIEGPVPGASEAFATAFLMPIDNERNPER